MTTPRLTVNNYRQDRLYPRVVRAIGEILAAKQLVSVPAVFVKMGMLSEEQLGAWRKGEVSYLERVILGSLGKTSRVVRLVAFHAHDLKLPPAPTHAAGNIRHKGRPLRFSKTGERKIEEAYQRVFGPVGSPAWRALAKPTRAAKQVTGGAVEQADAADEAHGGW